MISLFHTIRLFHLMLLFIVQLNLKTCFSLAQEIIRTPVIVDTDAGGDDFMAIAYLLTSQVNIEAITVVHGLCNTKYGANNIRNFLRFLNRDDIPVYEGEEQSIGESRLFPEEWRNESHSLFADLLDENSSSIQHLEINIGAVDFLRDRFMKHERPFRLLLLGPLTNIALAVRDLTPIALAEIVMMGGAVTVPGNLNGGVRNKPRFNDVAEWNIYCDPIAADEILSRQLAGELGRHFTLVGLDATNHVPLSTLFFEQFTANNLNNYGTITSHLLHKNKLHIENGHYYAWDQLAAMVLVNSTIVATQEAKLEIVTTGDNVGQTKLLGWKSQETAEEACVQSNTVQLQESCLSTAYIRVATSASKDNFYDLFVESFLASESN